MIQRQKYFLWKAKSLSNIKYFPMLLKHFSISVITLGLGL